MIVCYFYFESFTFFKLEDNPPLVIYANTPVLFESPFKLMKPVTRRNSQIFWGCHRIYRIQKISSPLMQLFWHFS